MFHMSVPCYFVTKTTHPSYAKTLIFLLLFHLFPAATRFASFALVWKFSLCWPSRILPGMFGTRKTHAKPTNHPMFRVLVTFVHKHKHRMQLCCLLTLGKTNNTSTNPIDRSCAMPRSHHPFLVVSFPGDVSLSIFLFLAGISYALFLSFITPLA